MNKKALALELISAILKWANLRVVVQTSKVGHLPSEKISLQFVDQEEGYEGEQVLMITPKCLNRLKFQ